MKVYICRIILNANGYRQCFKNVYGSFLRIVLKFGS